jgi:hypothetical protein
MVGDSTVGAAGTSESAFDSRKKALHHLWLQSRVAQILNEKRVCFLMKYDLIMKESSRSLISVDERHHASAGYAFH